MFLVIAREGAPFEPIHLFHKKTQTTNPVFSSCISDALVKENIPFTRKMGITHDFDLTQAIENDFGTLEQRCLLSFLIRSHVEFLSDATKRSCIDYFKQIARGKPEKFMLDIISDYFIIHGQIE